MTERNGGCVAAFRGPREGGSVGVDITPVCGPGTPPGVVAYLGLAAWQPPYLHFLDRHSFIDTHNACNQVINYYIYLLALLTPIRYTSTNYKFDYLLVVKLVS